MIFQPESVTYNMVKAESLISGDFGESFVAYLLAKENVDVVRAGTIGFDLFAIDHEGKILEKEKMVGISVKMRVSKFHERYVPTIPVGSQQVIEAQKIWKLEAWLAIVVGSIGREKKLACFLLPFREVARLRGRAKRQDVIAVSELYRETNEAVKRLF